MARKVPTIKGGDYEAVKAADGTWTILDVPIFASCRREFDLPGGKKVSVDFDRKWQERAVKRAKDKHAKSGVMRAIYPRHKADAKDDRDILGYFLPKAVEDVDVGGETKAVTFADYVGVPDSAYAELKSRKFPFKSVEAPIEGAPEYTGLAWLKEPPFHDDFPLQTVGREISETFAGEGVVGFSSSAGNVARALVRFGMADAPFTGKKDDEDDKSASGKTTADGGAAPVTPPPAGAASPATSPDASAANNGAAANGDPAADAVAAPADASVGPMLSGLMAMVSRMEETLKRLVGGVQQDGAGNPRPTAVQAAFDASGKPTAEFAAVTTERDALKAKVAEYEAADAKRKIVGEASTKIAGYALGGDPVEILTAKFDAGGEKAVAAFVDGIVLVGKKDPDAAWAADNGKATVDPLVAEFAHAPEALAAVSAEFDKIPSVARGDLTREKYVKHALRRAGVEPKSETK